MPDLASEKNRLYSTLSPTEREYADLLLRLMPNYRYESSGRPKLRLTPPPGLASAVAAAKMIAVSNQAGADGNSTALKRSKLGNPRMPSLEMVSELASLPILGFMLIRVRLRLMLLVAPTGGRCLLGLDLSHDAIGKVLLTYPSDSGERLALSSLANLVKCR